MHKYMYRPSLLLRNFSTYSIRKMPTIDKSFIMNHTCLRVKDPKVSVAFYEKNFGMKLLNYFHFESFSLYMVGYPTGDNANWAARDGVLELCHNHGAENDPDFKVNNGNGDKFRGFGHICVSVDNIEASEKSLLENDVKFQKKLLDGRQKNIAFALDPDGYWIELIEHGLQKSAQVTNKDTYKFNHTMIRVKDPKKSLNFYLNVLGMKLFSKRDFEGAKFSLYFLGYDHEAGSKEDYLLRDDQAAKQSIIELTHNWGTENDDTFEGYHNGNSTDGGAIQGYGHTCVSCTDPAKFCKEIENEFPDVEWSVKWNQGNLKNLAFVRDPDGYSVEIIPLDIFHDWVDGRPPQ